MYLDCSLFIMVIKAIQLDCDKIKGISVLLLETPLTRSKYISPYTHAQHLTRTSRTFYTFAYKLPLHNADVVHNSRFYLTKGVFIDHEFNLETEKCRKTLRPILHAAKQKSEYRYKSRLKGAKLVIDGKRYGVNDLDWLPDSLHPFEVSTKSNEETLGFFGELYPFSNFYPANFTYNGATYHSSEQLIQHPKALYCSDYDAANKIMLTKSALACKQLSYTINNYDHQGWTNAANERCGEGLRAKFTQNLSLLCTLLSTGDKLLVECSKDNIWGT